jgi:hypothetical protein
MLEYLIAEFEAILHALGLDHGIPPAVIEAAKVAAAALVHAAESALIPVVEKSIDGALSEALPAEGIAAPVGEAGADPLEPVVQV